MRYLGATMEELKRAYNELNVKVHPNENAHHREKAEGLFKQIGKAKDGLLDIEARRPHDADVQRGTRHQHGRCARAIGEQRHTAPNRRAEGQGSQTQ